MSHKCAPKAATCKADLGVRRTQRRAVVPGSNKLSRYSFGGQSDRIVNSTHLTNGLRKIAQVSTRVPLGTTAYHREPACKKELRKIQILL